MIFNPVSAHNSLIKLIKGSTYLFEICENCSSNNKILSTFKLIRKNISIIDAITTNIPPATLESLTGIKLPLSSNNN